MKSRCWPGLQSHLRFGVLYQATVGWIQLLVVVGLKSHFLSGVSKFLDAGQVLTIQPSHNMASKSVWESLHFIKTVSYVMQHKHGSDSASLFTNPVCSQGVVIQGMYPGGGNLRSLLTILDTTKEPWLQVVYDIWDSNFYVGVLFFNLLVINVLWNKSSFLKINTELCEKQPPVLTLCSNNRKIRRRSFEICWRHWPLLQFYRGMYK